MGVLYYFNGVFLEKLTIYDVSILVAISGLCTGRLFNARACGLVYYDQCDSARLENGIDVCIRKYCRLVAHGDCRRYRFGYIAQHFGDFFQPG
jgi:hypothetical protein